MTAQSELSSQAPRPRGNLPPACPNHVAPPLPGKGGPPSKNVWSSSRAPVWQNLALPRAFAPMSLGLTSVLTVVKCRNPAWTYFIRLIAHRFVATARAVLLLSCMSNLNPVSFRKACTKISSADAVSSAYSCDSSMAMPRLPVPCTRSLAGNCPRNKAYMSPDEQQIIFTSWFTSRVFVSGRVRNRVSRIPFKYRNTFLASVRTATVGDASRYDRLFVTKPKSG